MVNLIKKMNGAIAVVLVLSIVGCSTPAENKTAATTAPAASSAETTAPEAKKEEASAAPIKFTITYPDNPTLPFKEDWLGIKESAKFANADVKYEVIPSIDYNSKVSLMLNSGTAPDVILYQMVKSGEMAALALNGAIVPISDYAENTPNFNNYIKEWKMEEVYKTLELKDGKVYYMPNLYDIPFYDAGLILREDLLEKYSLQPPTTFEELHTVLAKFKEEDPKSYPLTNLVDQRVTQRMTMPSFGLSLGINSSTGTYVLSWDYDKKAYFAGAIDDKYKQYMTYFAQLYKDGLVDPEQKNEGDKWTSKLATGAATASYAYYDQFGGIVAMSNIEGLKFNLYPPLKGPAGAYHQPKTTTGQGPIFPKTTEKRSDFKQVVEAVDKMFYAPEMAEMWCLGVEGITYNKKDGKVVFVDEILNSPDGIYKSMQLKFGLGAAGLQNVWKNEREMAKYDENYAAINKKVQEMHGIQLIPPAAKLDDLEAEEAGLIQAPLSDAFNVWYDAFLTGKKSVEKDWDAYVAEMKSKNIDKLLELYENNKQ